MVKIRLLTLALVAAVSAATSAFAAELPSVAARGTASARSTGYDAVVEAVRQTVIAAQVSGAVIQLDVRAGDRVKAGQLLMRLDARAAEQGAVAGEAQAAAARAALDAASREYERQQQLFKKNYISQAALERAESQFKANQAQLKAQVAQAEAARTQSGFHLVRAPYAGVVAEVPVSLGDMAMPGRPLLTLYDPAQLRISAAVPQTVATSLNAQSGVRVELPGLTGEQHWQQPARLQVLPTVDPATHTVVLRAEMAAGAPGLVPGLFARLWLPGGEAQAAGRVYVPASAVIRRAELSAVYVLDTQGKPALRQVRVGRAEGDQLEILTGLMVGEKVVTDPQAAARQH